LDGIRFDDGTSWGLSTINTKVSGGTSASPAAAVRAAAVSGTNGADSAAPSDTGALEANITLLFDRQTAHPASTGPSIETLLQQSASAELVTTVRGGTKLDQARHDAVSGNPSVNTEHAELLAQQTSATWMLSNTFSEERLSDQHQDGLGVDPAKYTKWPTLPYGGFLLAEGLLGTGNGSPDATDSRLRLQLHGPTSGAA